MSNTKIGIAELTAKTVDLETAKVKDVVYHPIYGKGEIDQIDFIAGNLKIHARFENDKFFMTTRGELYTEPVKVVPERAIVLDYRECWVRENKYQEWVKRNFAGFDKNGLAICYTGTANVKNKLPNSIMQWKYICFDDPNEKEKKIAELEQRMSEIQNEIEQLKNEN